MSGSTSNRRFRHKMVNSQTLTGDNHNSFWESAKTFETRRDNRPDCIELHSQM